MQERRPKGATMTIDLQRGRFLRVMDGAGSTLTAESGEVSLTEQDEPLVEAFSDDSVSFDR